VKAISTASFTQSAIRPPRHPGKSRHRDPYVSATRRPPRNHHTLRRATSSDIKERRHRHNVKNRPGQQLRMRTKGIPTREQMDPRSPLSLCNAESISRRSARRIRPKRIGPIPSKPNKQRGSRTSTLAKAQPGPARHRSDAAGPPDTLRSGRCFNPKFDPLR